MSVGTREPASEDTVTDVSYLGRNFKIVLER